MNSNIYLNFNTLKDIQNLVDIKQEEHLKLDFKTIKHTTLNSKDDKRTLAKAISGFSNSSGGTIIWGVDARKNKSGIDCASSIEPISNIRLFLSRLNELTGSAVSPIVEGIEHQIIENDDETGFAITFVPESLSGPHMAKLGEDRYYKRSGDSFYKMEHFDLEDMFGRRAKPILELSIRVKNQERGSDIIVGIKNIGRGVAKAPYIALSVSQPYNLSNYGLDGNRHHGMQKIPYIGSTLPHRFGEGTNTVIHPSVIHEVALLRHKSTSSIKKKPTEAIKIEYEMAAENFQLTRKIKEVSLEELGY